MQLLHFSDFHFALKKGPQAEAMSSLLDFLRQEFTNRPVPIDVVFLAGDIAYTGDSTEYKNFERDFLQPLKSIDCIKGAKIFAVPGNHDVDCDAASPITWEGIRKRNQEIYFCENAEGKQARSHRVAVFSNYWDFVQRNGISSPNPNIEISAYFEEPSLPFDVLAVNTSFFSDKDEKSDEPITPCPLTSIRSHLNSRDRKRPLFILGHHPQKCFLPDQQTPFETLLVDKKVVYLHGHEHRPQLANNNDGTVRSIGFGAAYVANLGSQAQAPYRNTFTRCRIDTNFHLCGYSWDSYVGRWEKTTRSQFPNCFSGIETESQVAILKIPLLNDSEPPKTPPRVIHAIPRRAPQPQSIVPLSIPSEQVWKRLLTLSKNINDHYRHESDPDIHSTESGDGKSEFVSEQDGKRDLIVCISGSTQILTSKEIESYNTRLDTDDFRSVTILSLGKMSPDARDIYSRLQLRKSIEILVNQDLTNKWQQLISSAQSAILSSLDAASSTATILIDESNVYILIVERSFAPSFCIVDVRGAQLPPTHSVVTVLRDANPAFTKMPYRGEPVQTTEFPNLLQFDEQEYLKLCYKEYNAIKYAALANVGIRFTDFSLEDIYIDASACESEGAQSNRIDNLLEDHLAAYPASEKLKAQIKQQLRIHITGHERHETSRAREFCQKFGAVLLTGDPGSGKTCFVKSEILAYSRRSPSSSEGVQQTVHDWHSLHIPVMVPLSQAAAEPDLDAAGLLQIASRLIERRGLFLPVGTLNDLLKEGRLALFFDGLDEVVSVEKRAAVVQHINDLVTQAQPLGNRIVVTSRPAAVNVVNLLPTLRQLELQGLSETEIRTLASRVLTLKLSETPEGVVVDDKDLGSSDNSIVNQLLLDCQEKPGVARFASNPLLLTLLVMIYANSGAPSAKRHRIYEEAIKTLASVRGRHAGHPPVSVQDLRERLGAVALSVYHKQSGLLPTLAEVIEIVRLVMQKQRNSEVSKLEARKFIQKVAESTGLIAIGSGDDGDDQSVVTFMHHSFMEYFAAVALSRELDNYDVTNLVSQPRWMEVLTLLSGIIGENSDISPMLTRFVGDGTIFGPVDAKSLIFAMDCALECEVPSEEAIRLLGVSINECVSHGPARSDPWVRSEIGQRLAQLIAACGIGSFEDILIALIKSHKPDVCAAGISLVAYACIDEQQSKGILEALESCTGRGEELVLAALCDTIARVPWTRTIVLNHVVSKSLKRTERCKRAAFEAILAVPGMLTKHWADIINGLGDEDHSVKRLACKAAIEAGLDGDLGALNETKREVVADALRIVGESGNDQDYSPTKVRDETINRLMQSGYQRDRLIGIQLITCSLSGSQHSYSKLLAILQESDDHDEITAVLRSLRFSPQVRLLFNVGDLKRIAKLVDAGTTDVRKASIQLLGCFGADVNAIRPLIDRSFDALKTSEYTNIFGALGRSQVLHDDIGNLLESEIRRQTSGLRNMDDNYVREMWALFDCARSLGKNLNSEVSIIIRGCVQDYKMHDKVRGMAILAYCASTRPSKGLVDFLTALITSPPVKLMHELTQAPGVLAKNCRQSVECVMACVEPFSGLLRAAVGLHARISQREVTSENEFLTTELRDGIHELTEILVTFEDLINAP